MVQRLVNVAIRLLDFSGSTQDGDSTLRTEAMSLSAPCSFAELRVKVLLQPPDDMRPLPPPHQRGFVVVASPTSPFSVYISPHAAPLQKKFSTPPNPRHSFSHVPSFCPPHVCPYSIVVSKFAVLPNPCHCYVCGWSMFAEWQTFHSNSEVFEQGNAKRRDSGCEEF